MSSLPEGSIEAAQFDGTGVVLLADPSEHNRFLRQQGILVIQHSRGSPSHGVTLENPTPFTMGEMAAADMGGFRENGLCTGGDNGDGSVVMVHSVDGVEGSRYLGNGLYIGGVAHARQLVERGDADPASFKFFFNHVEWRDGELEKQLGHLEYDAAVVPPSLVLRQPGSFHPPLWSLARRALREVNALHDSSPDLEEDGE